MPVRWWRVKQRHKTEHYPVISHRGAWKSHKPMPSEGGRGVHDSTHTEFYSTSTLGKSTEAKTPKLFGTRRSGNGAKLLSMGFLFGVTVIQL